LRYIIVYPTTFVVAHENRDQAGIVEHNRRGLLGESWQVGKVILAWDSVLQGARNFFDGQNVILHEFAHQLDSETGSANGVSLLGGASSYVVWAGVLSEEFKDLQEDSRQKRRSLLDHYGATNPAEFFAVATETFFERPRQNGKNNTRGYSKRWNPTIALILGSGKLIEEKPVTQLLAG
jgi:Mlc titration factor MtfA (ptsG expression regulator)